MTGYTRMLLSTWLLFPMLASASRAQSVTIANLPPSVVKTTPSCGDDDVDPSTSEIKVTYSKPMTDGSWSFSQVSDDSFPDVVGRPKYSADRRTCTLTVKLKPGTTYAFWLNSDKFHNFKDASGKPAVPYLLVFKTAKGGASR